MTIVKIAFVVPRNSPEGTHAPILYWTKTGKVIQLPVDLEKLDPFAQRIACGIRTTDNTQPLSRVMIKSHYALGDLQSLNQAVNSACWDENVSIPSDGLFLPSFLNQQETFQWRWNRMLPRETPESYLIRNAAAMAQFGEITFLAVEQYTSLGAIIP